MAKLVSKTYGEALFEIALDKEKSSPGAASALLEEASQLLDILKSNKEFDRLMKHPGIAKTEKLDVLRNVFETRVSPEMYGFLHLIVEKDRYRDLTDILEFVFEKMKEYKKIGVAYVSTAIKLSAAQEAQVRGKLMETAPYDSLEIHYLVQPDLIGGMVIRIGDRVVDSSVKSRLNDLTKQLLQIQLG